MLCPVCGYDGPYNAKGHPWAGDVTPSANKWCRGRRNRPASREEFNAVMDAFRPFAVNHGKTTEHDQ